MKNWNDKRQTAGLAVTFALSLALVGGLSWQWRLTESADLLRQWDLIKDQIHSPEPHAVTIGSSLIRHAFAGTTSCEDHLTLHRLATIGLRYDAFMRSGILDSMLNDCPACSFFVQAEVPYFRDSFQPDAPLSSPQGVTSFVIHSVVEPFQYEIWALKNLALHGTHYANLRWIRDSTLTWLSMQPREQKPMRKPLGNPEHTAHFNAWVGRAREASAEVHLVQIHKSPGLTHPASEWIGVDFNGLDVLELGQDLSWEHFHDPAHVNSAGRAALSEEFCDAMDGFLKPFKSAGSPDGSPGSSNDLP
jgi:hypothetical protein